MPHSAGFDTLVCVRCKQLFELPSLGESAYGARILYGERGTAHRYVVVIDHPVWSLIATLLPPRPSSRRRGSALLAPARLTVDELLERVTTWWRVLAALADPIAGEQLRVDAVCPRCGADGTHFRKPASASDTPRIGEVDDAEFTAFLSLTAEAQRERVVATAREA